MARRAPTGVWGRERTCGRLGSGWAEEEPEPKRDWKRILLAAFIIVLLVGSLVVFFVLYLLSLL